MENESSHRPAPRPVREEISDLELLHSISTALIGEHEIQPLYNKILDAAVAISVSQFGSMQVLHTGRGPRGTGALRLLASRNYDDQSIAQFEWVTIDSKTTCGLCLRTGNRTVITDVEQSDFLAGSAELETFRKAGIRSMQTTPLLSRTGQLLGVISTHWTEPHEPSPRDLRLMDILARQAADLIERTGAEVAMRESEGFNRGLMQGSADCVKVLDLDGRVLLMNEPGLCLMEVDDPNDVCGKEWLTLWPEVARAEVERALSLAKAGQRHTFNAFCPTMKGTRKWWEITVTPVRDVANGNIVRLLSVSRDITPQMAIEVALRESEDRFRMVADNIAQLAWTCDELGDVTWYNQRWLDYTGMTFEEMKDWGWKRVQHPDHVDRVVAGVMRSRESGEPWEDTFPLRGADGEYRWFLSRAKPIRNRDGKVVRWFGTNTDITDSKRADELQKLLTGELSHRVKNMLATVQAIATQTLRHNPKPADFVSSFGGRIQSMSLVHSQLSTNEWKGTELRDIVREQTKLGPVDDSNISISGPNVRLGVGVVPQVAMMVHELGTNSLKYGALSAKTGTVAINWTVRDNTLHMAWAEQGGPPVKAPIRRGFGTTLIERSAVGAGGKAEMLLLAEGVKWEITLPLPDYEPQAEVRSTRKSPDRWPSAGVKGLPADKSLSGVRILIVEDEPLVAMEMADQLEEHGAKVVGTAGNAADALAIVDSDVLHVALLDANLSGRPVDDIAAALTRKNIPFAFVSGYGRDALPRAFASADALAKPFTASQLLDLTLKLAGNPPGGVISLKPRERA